jgi:AcrR family transcriptional regulator
MSPTIHTIEEDSIVNEDKGSEENEIVLKRRDRKRAETREILFQTAMRLFAEKDFDAVTVEMITEAADMGKGTFFNHFKNKEGVIGAFFEAQLRMLTEALPFVLDESAPEPSSACGAKIGSTAFGIGSPLWQRLVAVAHRGAEREGKSRKMTRTLLALSMTNDAVRAAHLNVKERFRAIVREIVVAGQKTGELRDDRSAEELAEFLCGVYFMALTRWAHLEDGEDLHDIINSTFAIAWEGVCPQR